MNCEKKYEEALKKARIYRDNAKAVEDYAAVARYENIFPELREEEKPLTPFQQCLNLILHKVYYASVPGKMENVDKFILDTVKKHTDELVELAKKHEYTDCKSHKSDDEKVRKWLVDYFSSIKDTAWIHRNTTTCKQILEWLENQKEKIPYTDFVVKSHKGDDNNPYDMPASKAQEYIFHRGFSIPFIDSEVYVDERHLIQTVGNILRWADEHPKEQKPAEWSKEDSKRYISIGATLETSAVLSKEDYDANMAWLRDLVNAKKYSSPKPAWKPSELEKGALRTAIHILTDERNFPKAAKQLQNILDAFEGKESRKDWKPSEEQKVKWLVDDDYHELTENGKFILGSVGLGYNGYYIPYSDLLKLPKED